MGERRRRRKERRVSQQQAKRKDTGKGSRKRTVQSGSSRGKKSSVSALVTAGSSSCHNNNSCSGGAHHAAAAAAAPSRRADGHYFMISHRIPANTARSEMLTVAKGRAGGAAGAPADRMVRVSADHHRGSSREGTYVAVVRAAAADIQEGTLWAALLVYKLASGRSGRTLSSCRRPAAACMRKQGECSRNGTTSAADTCVAVLKTTATTLGPAARPCRRRGRCGHSPPGTGPGGQAPLGALRPASAAGLLSRAGTATQRWGEKEEEEREREI